MAYSARPGSSALTGSRTKLIRHATESRPTAREILVHATDLETARRLLADARRRAAGRAPRQARRLSATQRPGRRNEDSRGVRIAVARPAASSPRRSDRRR